MQLLGFVSTVVILVLAASRSTMAEVLLVWLLQKNKAYRNIIVKIRTIFITKQLPYTYSIEL